MPKSALTRRIGRICLLGGLLLALGAAGCGSDRLKKEIEEKNRTIAQLAEQKSKAEADLAAKDLEMRATVEKLQKQYADAKRQADNCAASLSELRKEKSRAKSAKDAKPARGKTKSGSTKRSER